MWFPPDDLELPATEGLSSGRYPALYVVGLLPAMDEQHRSLAPLRLLLGHRQLPVPAPGPCKRLLVFARLGESGDRLRLLVCQL